jgi:hypothetical protein
VSAVLQPAPTAAEGARADLRQLVAAGTMRFVIGFDESRQYLDSVGALTRIPRSPAWLLGAFNADGAAVPLVDMEAWAHRTAPAPWRLARDPAEHRRQAAQSPDSPASSGLRALRMGDSTGAWAIRVTQAPAVVSLEPGQSRAISNHLPLGVSDTNGRLMPHAAMAWLLADHAIALQIHWSQVAEAIRQELSGLATVPVQAR